MGAAHQYTCSAAGILLVLLCRSIFCQVEESMASKEGSSIQVVAEVTFPERPLLAQRQSLLPPSYLLRALPSPSIGLGITLPKEGCAGAGTQVVCLCMRVTSNQQCPIPPWHSITSTTHFLPSPARRLTRQMSLPT